MSNPTTYYKIYNPNTGLFQDLSGIFQPLSLGTIYHTPTGYKVGGNDLNQLFSTITSIYNDIGYNTHYNVNGLDLRYMFNSYNSFSYFITGKYTQTSQTINGIYYQYVFTFDPSGNSNTFMANIDLSLNYLVVGGGGNGGNCNGSSDPGGGGGGGGEVISNSFVSSKNLYYTMVVGVNKTNSVIYNNPSIPIITARYGLDGATGKGKGGTSGNPLYIGGSSYVQGLTNTNGGGGGGGGNGGAGSNGSSLTQGGSGGAGTLFNGITYGIGGQGGSSGVNGNNGAGYGGGGGGARMVNNTTGNTGKNGVIMIYFNVYNQFIYSFDSSTTISNTTIIANAPIINTNNSFKITNSSYNISKSSNTYTVTLTYTYIDNGSDDGVSFANCYSFYNTNTTNLKILKFGKIPLSRNTGNALGGQFSGATLDSQTYGERPDGEPSYFWDYSKNLTDIKFLANDIPSILSNTSLFVCFAGLKSFNESNIINWNTSNVIDMNWTFRNCIRFNQPIGVWNTSNVTNMYGVFEYADDTDTTTQNYEMVFNQNLSNWDTSKVTTMYKLFQNWTGIAHFNNGEPPGSSNAPLNWDTSKVKSMSYLFFNCIYFNQPFGPKWDTRLVQYMMYTFSNSRGDYLFNQYIGDWDTSNVNNMYRMFGNNGGNSYFNNGQSRGQHSAPLNWNTINVTKMYGMFSNNSLTGYTCFNQYIGNWDTSNVTDMGYMFACHSANCDFNNGEATGESTALLNWNTLNVTNMSYMFTGCGNFNQNIDYWDTSNVQDVSFMFGSCIKFNQPLSSWNTSNVTNMSYMFINAQQFNNGYSPGDTNNPMNFSIAANPDTTYFGYYSPLKSANIGGSNNNTINF